MVMLILRINHDPADVSKKNVLVFILAPDFLIIRQGFQHQLNNMNNKEFILI